MMTDKQAIQYGKRIGVRYYVKNSYGGLLGGFTTKKAAEECKKRFEAEYCENPWNKGVTVHIEKV